MNTWLLLDVSYMCYRAFHTTGGLKYREISTGVIYGFLRDVLNLCEIHNTCRVVYCFDCKPYIRSEHLPEYKTSRHKSMTREEKEARKEMRTQMLNLRKDYLPRIGFRNILCEKGYEADDLIASVCKRSLDDEDEAIIVSADQDLYQLLSGQVRIWNANKGIAYTIQAFNRDFGISPKKWARVKAIAGCSGDDVPGVAGVGDKTAAKYLRGDLNGGAKVIAIEKATKMIERNLPLVRLPFEGTPTYTLRKDRFSLEGWRSVIEDLGLRSLGRADTSIFSGGRRRGLGMK